MSGSSSAISCYGKLPFHPEYLRIGLGSPAALAVVRWIDAAHAALSTGKHGEAGAGRVQFAMQAPDGRATIAGVIMQSADAGKRKHPISFFVEQPAAGGDGDAHLLPLALADTWSALGDLLERPVDAMGTLQAALAGPCPAVAVAQVQAAHEAWMADAAPDGPWMRLTQLATNDATMVATNLLTIAEAQREARQATEGVAFVVSLPVTDPAHHAAAWLDLFAAATGRRLAPTALALFGATPRLCAVYRPPDGEDLAAVLTGIEKGSIDDLNDDWGVEPPAAASLDGILAGSRSLAELRLRLRSAA